MGQDWLEMNLGKELELAHQFNAKAGGHLINMLVKKRITRHELNAALVHSQTVVSLLEALISDLRSGR